MKKLILLLLFIPLVSFSQTYTVKKTGNNQITGESTIEIKENKKGYDIPGPDFVVPENNANQIIQNNNAAMSNMIISLAASGAFATARQKAQDITSLNGKNINKYKYIVVANISASKEKEIPKIRKVINQDLSKTNFIIIQNLDNIPDDLNLNPNLGLYLYLISENVNWPFKNVSLSLTNANGDLIHQRVVNHDRTASFLTGLVMQSIKTHPHKFDINASIKEKKKEAVNVNSTSKDDAIEELKKLKELLDLELITQEEFNKKSKELKKIILGN